jgi:hypothetical protein
VDIPAMHNNISSFFMGVSSLVFSRASSMPHANVENRMPFRSWVLRTLSSLGVTAIYLARTKMLESAMRSFRVSTSTFTVAGTTTRIVFREVLENFRRWAALSRGC